MTARDLLCYDGMTCRKKQTAPLFVQEGKSDVAIEKSMHRTVPSSVPDLTMQRNDVNWQRYASDLPEPDAIGT